MILGIFSPASTASALPKCPTSVITVPTPQDALATLTSYVKTVLHLGIKNINSKSILKSGSQWTVGSHSCYYAGSSIPSGYNGFLPSGVKSGYEVSVDLRGQLMSGGSTMFLEFAKVKGKWKVLSAGSGP